MKFYQIQISETQREWLQRATEALLVNMDPQTASIPCEAQMMGRTVTSNVGEEIEALSEMLKEEVMITEGMNDFTS